MQSKKAALLKAERAYWNHQRLLREQHDRIAALTDRPIISLPSDISSTVWALKDGAAFVRYKSTGTALGVGFRIWEITLEEWGRIGLIVPLADREFSIAQAGVQGVANWILVDCTFGEVQIPYAEFSAMRYGDASALPSVERAIVDYQLAYLGQVLRNRDIGTDTPASARRETVIEALEGVARSFEELLAGGTTREEELQTFIKEHPFILHPSAALIPKQKLGEDFVTDFVIVTPLEQGPVFCLVEIERASHPVIVKDGALSAQANHAIKQTRDWDIWLQENQAYLRGKLPGIESPHYLIIIGRSNGMSESDKSYLRAYNREWRTTKLLTYDDLLAQFRATIERLKQMARTTIAA